jgi:hypothetical protein
MTEMIAAVARNRIDFANSVNLTPAADEPHADSQHGETEQDGKPLYHTITLPLVGSDFAETHQSRSANVLVGGIGSWYENRCVVAFKRVLRDVGSSEST